MDDCTHVAPLHCVTEIKTITFFWNNVWFPSPANNPGILCQEYPDPWMAPATACQQTSEDPSTGCRQNHALRPVEKEFLHGTSHWCPKGWGLFKVIQEQIKANLAFQNCPAWLGADACRDRNMAPTKTWILRQET